MNRSNHTSRLASTCRAPGLRIRAAVAAFAMAAAPLGVRADVVSLTVSPADVASGGASTGTVKLDTTGTLTHTVVLESSNPALASVPASVSVGATGATFPITTTTGQAGCSTLKAKQSRTTAERRAVLFVAPVVSPESTLKLVLSKPKAAGGESLTGTVSVLQPTGIVSVVQSVTVASSNPSVTVPASATLRAGREVPLQATFSIATSVVGSTGCSVISATYNGVTTRALLKLFSAGG